MDNTNVNPSLENVEGIKVNLHIFHLWQRQTDIIIYASRILPVVKLVSQGNAN